MCSQCLTKKFQGHFGRGVCMLIDAVCPAGQNRRTGFAVETWEGRTRGGAVQKRHSLALVRGCSSAGNECSSCGMNDEGERGHFKGVCGELSLTYLPEGGEAKNLIGGFSTLSLAVTSRVLFINLNYSLNCFLQQRGNGLLFPSPPPPHN